MRLPFIHLPQDKVVAVANDLIVRFGREAHDEALHLAEVAARMRANENRHLYFLAAREIERSLGAGWGAIVTPYERDCQF